MVVPNGQWLVRWGCLALISVGTVMHLVAVAAPRWVLDQAQPGAYATFLQFLRDKGVLQPDNSTSAQAVSLAVTRVGLWQWCAEVTLKGDTYEACDTPGISQFPDWWKACQALSVVGAAMGVLAVVCASLEVYYTRRGVRHSGLVVLCAISCFVAAVGMGLSHGMFATKYQGRLPSIVDLPGLDPDNVFMYFYPPSLDWAFGVGAAGATLIGATGILLVAFITRTYPTYQRTENVIV